MKLVDILARELKVWPVKFGEYAICAPTEGTFAVWFNDRRPYPFQGGWADVGCVELWLQEEPEDRKATIITRAQWQAAVDALKAEKVVEWNGDGLPPVGLQVEDFWPGDTTPEWRATTILFISDENIITMTLNGERHYSREKFDEEKPIFRMARTAEQIAAEEREASIKQIRKDAIHPSSDYGISWEAAEALYESGYRKQAKE